MEKKFLDQNILTLYKRDMRETQFKMDANNQTKYDQSIIDNTHLQSKVDQIKPISPIDNKASPHANK